MTSKFKVGDRVTYTDYMMKRHRLGFEIMVVEWTGLDYDFFKDDINRTQTMGGIIVVTNVKKQEWDWEDSLRLVSPLEELL